jgi:hypothetical protein
MTLPSPAIRATEIAREKPSVRAKHRGMTLGHWLLIVILAALCVDIGIRIVAFHRASLATAQALNSQKAIQQLIDNMRKSDEALIRQRLDSTKEWQRTQELFEEFMKRRQNTPAPRDPSKGTVIPLCATASSRRQPY